MTDPEIQAMAGEILAQRLFENWLHHTGRDKSGEVIPWLELTPELKSYWLKEADAILSLCLNEQGEPDPDGNIRIGVYLEKAELPEGTFDYNQHERIFREAGFRKVVSR